MICINLKSRILSCKKPTGGISDVGFFDPNDLNFIQALIDGYPGPYTAVAARTGASGQLIFPVTFNIEEGEMAVDQSVQNGSSDYQHKLTLQLPKRNQSLTNFLQRIDDAIYCCGLGVIIRYNSGEIFLAGEKYVNGSSIPRFVMRQNGSNGSSGKVRTDLNGYNLVIQGGYDRDLYEYSGTWESLEAFMGTGGGSTTYDTSLTYVSSATASGAGVNTNAGATDANKAFEFDSITNPTGLATTMKVYLGYESDDTLQMVATFPGAYTTKAFRLKVGSTWYTGAFADGVVVLNQVSSNVTPVAPTALVLDDTANTASWTNTPGYGAATFYEYSTNYTAGTPTWSAATVKPITGLTGAIAAGAFAVRVKAGTGRNAGAALVSNTAFTATPAATPNTVAWGQLAAGASDLGGGSLKIPADTDSNPDNAGGTVVGNLKKVNGNYVKFTTGTTLAPNKAAILGIATADDANYTWLSAAFRGAMYILADGTLKGFTGTGSADSPITATTVATNKDLKLEVSGDDLLLKYDNVLKYTFAGVLSSVAAGGALIIKGIAAGAENYDRYLGGVTTLNAS